MRTEIAIFAAGVTLAGCGGAEKPAQQVVTWQQYQEVTAGMRIEEVKKIFGQPGKQLAGQDVGGRIIRTYQFGTSEAFCMIMFDDHTVISKLPGTLQAPAL